MILEKLFQLICSLINFIPISSISWSTILTLLIPLLLSSLVLIFYWSAICQEWKRLKIVDELPGPKCTSLILGNIPFDMIWQTILQSNDYKMGVIMAMSSITGYTQVFNKQKIFRIWLSWEPLVFVWHPDTVEKILSNNFLLEKSAQYKFLHPWLGTGLLTSDGQKWRLRRKMLIPAFHFKILHDFVPVFNEQAKILIKKLRGIAKRKCNNCQVVDIVPIITACTLDIICETIMGVSIGAQKTFNNKYCKSVTEVGECFLERLMQPQYWLDLIYYRSGSGQKFSTNLIRLHNFTRKVIKERKAEKLNSKITIRYRVSPPTNDNGNGDDSYDSIKKQLEEQQKDNDRRKVFLDLLLDHHLNSLNDSTNSNNPTSSIITEEDIREEVDTFMFEGHDTTAMALSWTLYLLGHHPEIQARAAAEVDSVFDEMIDDIDPIDPESNDFPSMISDDDNNGQLLDLEKIKSLKYLECCIKEGLRLCPSVPFVGRKLHEDMSLNGYTVPKGTILFVYIYMLHRDPDVFPEPEQFNPDRFLAENSQGRHPFAYVPFSAGPRNCIGQRFAMSELKVVLAYLLRYFRFESLDCRDQISAMMEMVYRPKSPLRLRVFQRRKQEDGLDLKPPNTTNHTTTTTTNPTQPITLEMLLMKQQQQRQHRQSFDGRSSSGSGGDGSNNSLMDLGMGSSNPDEDDAAAYRAADDSDEHLNLI